MVVLIFVDLVSGVLKINNKIPINFYLEVTFYITPTWGAKTERE